MSERAELRKALEQRLVPELLKRGFVRVDPEPEALGREVQAAFPFGRLRRPSKTGSELVEIQVHPRDAAFRLNIGFVPPGGVDHRVGGKLAESDVWVQYLDRYYELCARRFMGKWFSARKVRLAKRPADFNSLVDSVVALIPEIEQLFREGRPGSHMREVAVGR